MNLPLFPQDKANHFVCGALVFLSWMIVVGSPLVAFSVTTLFGIGKEALDHYQNRQALAHGLPAPHSVELLDAVYTAAGGFIPFVSCMLCGAML